MLHHISPRAANNIANRNELKQSTAALLGMAQGMLADHVLSDAEIEFLHKWLGQYSAVRNEWPGNILHAQIGEVLSDGSITNEERAHLITLLQAIIGDQMEDVPEASPVTQLALDRVPHIQFEARTFCFSGEFVMGPRSTCARMTEKRGGVILDRATTELDYLIVGSIGNKQWKNNSFGTKIESTLKFKHSCKASTLLIAEDHWANALNSNGATGL